MAFPCTTADVQALNPQRTYSATSKPTLTQLGTYINMIAAEIRGVIRKHGITESALDTNAVALLNYMNALGMSAMAEQNAVSGNAMTMTEGSNKNKSKYDDMLAEFSADAGILEDPDKFRSRPTTISPEDADDDTEDENWQPEFDPREDD
jgi:hypothetical protein